MNKEYRSQIAWGVALFLCAAAAIACYFLFLRWEQFKQVLSKLSSVLSPVTVGVIIAFLLDSMVRTFIRLMNKLPPKGNVDSKKRQKVEKVFSILLSELVLCAAISLVIGTLIPQIITSIRTIIANFNQYIRNIEEWAEPFLEEYPDDFRAAALSSPMIRINSGNTPAWQVKALSVLSVLLGWQMRTLPGSREFSGEDDFENSCSVSRSRT